MPHASSRRHLLSLLMLAAVAAAPLAAQVAPTLPPDTLNARSRDSVAAARMPADTTPAARPAKRTRNPRLRVPH